MNPPPAPAWTTAWPLAPLALALLAGAWGMRREVRPDRATLAVLLLALAVRWIAFPVDRHVYDGHEADYYDIFLGRRPVTRGGPILLPAMQWFHAALGLLSRDERLPLAAATAFGLLSIGAWAGALARLTGRRVALAAAALMAGWGLHASWSLSAYHVIHPFALAAVAAWAVAAHARAAPWLPAALLAGGAGGLALSMRLEAAALGLVACWWWAVGGGRRWRFALVAAPLAGLGLLAWRLAVGHGEVPGAGERLLAFTTNIGFLAPWAPFDRWPLLLVPAIGAAVGLRRWPTAFLPLVLLPPLVHLAGATFDDYGGRHALFGAPGLAACLGALAAVRWGFAPLLAAALLVARDAAGVARWFYAPEEQLARALPADLPRLGPEDLRRCALITEDFRILPEPEQRSHFNLLRPEEVRALREAYGCIWWVAGIEDHRYDSRAVRDRALRIRHLYELRPVGVLRWGEGGVAAEVFEVGRRRVPGPRTR